MLSYISSYIWDEEIEANALSKRQKYLINKQIKESNITLKPTCDVGKITKLEEIKFVKKLLKKMKQPNHTSL